MFSWLNANAPAIQAIAAMVSVLVAAVLAWITARYVRLTPPRFMFSTFFSQSFTTFRTAPNTVRPRHRTRGGHMARKSFRGYWLTRQQRLLPMIALATAFTSAAPAESAAQSSTIFVSTVAQLYEAVNDATNAGATIVLAAGTYTLSAGQPNGGRLDLQLDMSLVGVENDAGAATIDASTLLQSSFNFKIGRTGIIRTGRGNNTIEW